MRDASEVRAAHPRLEERYFERMDASLGDKVKMLTFLPPIVEGQPAPRVLDVGAGSGALSNALSELGYDVTALDASDDAVMRIRKTFPHLTTATLLANQTAELGKEKFDAIICSSILHEVFSYGDNIHRTGHYSSLQRAIDSFRVSLKKDGVLIIRDGVLPTDWEERGTIQLLDEHEESSVYKYLEMCPFANGGTNVGLGNLVALTKVAEKTFEGNVRSLLEFAYTYTWGLESYPRETQELYAVKTLDEYAEMLAHSGFTVEHAESYLQEGYVKNLKHKMTLRVSGSTNQWFDSNAIWVAYKD